jgi:tetratricopeptide (TPR) repeat protein
MDTPLPRRLSFGAVVCALLILATGIAHADSAPTGKPRASSSATTKQLPPISSAQLLYSMFLGEIAYARGDIGDALLTYNELAKRTQDPRIVSRANEIGVTSVLVHAQEKPAEAESALKTALARQEGARENLLLQLPTIFARVADKEEVARIITRLTAPYLNLASANLARALAELAAKHTEAANAAAQAALRLNPNLERAALVQAQTVPEAQHKEAMEALGTFGQQHPQALDARLAYARWLVQDKRGTEATQAYRQLLTEFPDNDLLTFAIVGISAQVNDLDTTETLLHRLIDHHWGDIDRLRLLLGALQEEKGQVSEALQTYDAVLPGTQFAAAQLHKAQILSRNGKATEAIQSLRDAITVSTSNTIALKEALAQLLSQDKQLEGARILLQEVLAAEPDNLDALYDAALLDEQLGNPDLMEQRLRHIIKIQPEHAHALNALGYSLADRNIRLDEADSLLAHAIKLSPDDPAIQDSVGWLRFRQGRRTEALEYLQRAYNQFKDPEVAGHLIEVLWSDGQHSAAHKLLNEALKLTPTNVPLKALSARLGM